mmetsp:Transcript_30671/g.73508  ORF Transcript_30671/g.73508 Transcript_30671/m.73508 type:complete len:269 (+) Transcript_30671:1144-1950(+)
MLFDVPPLNAIQKCKLENAPEHQVGAEIELFISDHVMFLSRWRVHLGHQSIALPLCLGLHFLLFGPLLDVLFEFFAVRLLLLLKCLNSYSCALQTLRLRPHVLLKLLHVFSDLGDLFCQLLVHCVQSCPLLPKLVNFVFVSFALVGCVIESSDRLLQLECQQLELLCRCPRLRITFHSTGLCKGRKTVLLHLFLFLLLGKISPTDAQSLVLQLLACPLQRLHDRVQPPPLRLKLSCRSFNFSCHSGEVLLTVLHKPRPTKDRGGISSR